jgi:hypothetical protein
MIIGYVIIYHVNAGNNTVTVSQSSKQLMLSFAQEGRSCFPQVDADA